MPSSRHRSAFLVSTRAQEIVSNKLIAHQPTAHKKSFPSRCIPCSWALPGDEICSFTVKVDRLKDTDVGEFLQFHVTVKADLKELPERSGELRVFNGKEFVSACEVHTTGSDGERSFSFRVAARYAEKSTFTYAQTSDFDHISHWFYLKDFVESK